MFWSVTDIATIMGETSFSLQSLVLGSLPFSKAPLLGDKDLKKGFKTLVNER
jgi:hypothetical protein